MDLDPSDTFAAAARYMAMAPDDATWAREAVRPYLHMTPEERIQELVRLNAVMDALLAGRMPEREDGEMPFWKLWRGDHLARPR